MEKFLLAEKLIRQNNLKVINTMWCWVLENSESGTVIKTFDTVYHLYEFVLKEY